MRIFILLLVLVSFSCSKKKDDVNPTNVNTSKSATLHIEYSATQSGNQIQSFAKLVINNKDVINKQSGPNTSNSITYDEVIQGNQDIRFSVYATYPSNTGPISATRITRITFNGVEIFNKTESNIGSTGYSGTLPFIN